MWSCGPQPVCSRASLLQVINTVQLPHQPIWTQCCLYRSQSDHAAQSGVGRVPACQSLRHGSGAFTFHHVAQQPS